MLLILSNQDSLIDILYLESHDPNIILTLIHGTIIMYVSKSIVRKGHEATCTLISNKEINLFNQTRPIQSIG